MVRRDYSGDGLNPLSFSATFTLITTICLFAQSCGPIGAMKIDHKVAAYHNAAETINVGDPKSKVLAILPDQTNLAGSGRPREATIIDGKKMEIFYFRAARVPDGKTTDDELVPYLFIDDTLHAIGWTAVRAFANSR